MKTFVIILLALVAATGNGFSQNLIAVQNGGEPKFYQQVDDAIVNAQDGDTIYIPGGNWNISQQINKRLHLVGVGHNPDATSATFPTTLNSITLAAGAGSGSLTGIYLKNGIRGTNDPVNSYTIFRCRISGDIVSHSNFNFVQNVLEGIIASGPNYDSATNCSFLNNIINTNFYSDSKSPFINSIFKNNIFLRGSGCYLDCFYNIKGQYLLVENNIFLTFDDTGQVTFSDVSNSTAKNNLFVERFPFPNGTTNVDSKNITGQPQSTIFVNQEGNTFNYTHDYHLQINSSGKNAGTDGTDVGIYGGIYPWKEGSIPFNPHFQQVQVSPKTDANGNLNVNIKVEAQER